MDDNHNSSENLLSVPESTSNLQWKCDYVGSASSFNLNDPGTWPLILASKIFDMLVVNGPSQINSLL